MKQDPKLVASLQKHEAEYISKRFKVPIKDVRSAMKKGGRSRAKIYAILREMGHEIKTK